MLSKPLQPDAPKRSSIHRVPVPKRIRALEAQLKGLRCKVGIDVEHTGGAAGLGATFSMGIVGAARIDGVWKVVVRVPLSYNPLTAAEQLEAARLWDPSSTVDNTEARIAFLRGVWAEHKWDQDTLDNFWLKNLELFGPTMAAVNQPSEAAFNAAVGDALRKIEADYGKNGDTVEYVWDTMHVDPVRCDRILERNQGELGMNYFRGATAELQGRHGCQSWHLRSLLVGLVAGALCIDPVDVDYKIFLSPLMVKLRAMADAHTKHTHDALDDAEHILWMYIYAPEAVAEFVAELKAEAAKEAADQIALDATRKYWHKYNHGHYVKLQSMDEPALTLDSYHSMHAAVDIISRYLDAANAETPSLPVDAPPRSVSVIEGDHQEVYKLAEAAALALQIKYPEWIFYIAQGGCTFEYTGVRALERRNEPQCKLCDGVAHQQASPDPLLRGTLIADVLADGGAAEDAARAETESAIRAIVESN